MCKVLLSLVELSNLDKWPLNVPCPGPTSCLSVTNSPFFWAENSIPNRFCVQMQKKDLVAPEKLQGEKELTLLTAALIWNIVFSESGATENVSWRQLLGNSCTTGHEWADSSSFSQQLGVFLWVAKEANVTLWMLTCMTQVAYIWATGWVFLDKMIFLACWMFISRRVLVSMSDTGIKSSTPSLNLEAQLLAGNSQTAICYNVMWMFVT